MYVHFLNNKNIPLENCLVIVRKVNICIPYDSAFSLLDIDS